MSPPSRVRVPPSLAVPALVSVIVAAGSWVALVRLGAWLGFGPHYPLTSLVGAGLAGLGAWWMASLAIDVARIARNRRAGRAAP